ncbi:phosphate ABC transporter permease PstA [Halalkalirubrum salinum]|uniref:phosphate ABC transporter permease PstA n=1 Tax=Halalkalirubrum salinum TaxID=2563889 RepID=UPI0010FB1347|nr:phosphate ABC transporter permease PstA [Halalkalirubrum salinum]
MGTKTQEHEWVGRSNALTKLRGGAFKYACLGTALFGIVTLLVLLAYVTLDAIELQEAEPIWFAILGVTFVLPVALFGWYVWGTPAADVAKTSVGGVLLAAGLGGFFIVAFTIITPHVWAAYVVFAVFPAIAAVRYGDRLPAIDGSGPAVMATVTLGAIVATVFLEPITAIFAMAKPWLLYLLTLAIPTATALIWWSRTREDRAATIAAAATVGGTIALGLLVEVGVLETGGAPIVFLIGFVLPATIVLAHGYRRGPEARAGLLALPTLVGGVVALVAVAWAQGVPMPNSWIRPEFYLEGPSRTPENAGLYPPIVGSVFMLIVMVVAVFPLGVGAAIYLEEYAPNNRLTRLIRINLTNLAGVPSVVYGLLGLAIIARHFGLGRGTVITAGLTVGLLVLPIVIIASQEAIRSVPDSVREASYGMGASRWQTTREVVLPEAFPGILTGTILALGRAIGETAPLIMIGASTSVSSAPTELFGNATAMPLQIFSWQSRVQPDFRYGVVAAGVITLLVILLGMNAAAIILRNRLEKR